jgi:bifunctional oligoribonuclease and PAP phosphatase NrnA
MKKEDYLKFKEINKKIENSKKILISSHESPDADAFGSVLSLNLVLNKMGLDPYLYISGFSGGSLGFLPDFFKIRGTFPENIDFDLVFGLDYGNFTRLNIPENCFSDEKIVTVDHHEGYHKGEIKVVDKKSSSACEMIYEWLKNIPPSGLEIEKDIAECLLTGIVADTGGFSHISTSPETLKAASFLLSKGASLPKITNSVLSSKSIFQKGSSGIFGKVLSRIKVVPDQKLVYSWLSFDDLNRSFLPFDLNGIPSVLCKEAGCNFALFLFEYEKRKIKGSLRSEPFKGIRVDSIARKLGGGGHPYASGFKQEGTVDSVLKNVLSLVE